MSWLRCGGVQVLQWVFAGAPNHPALRELCDWIRDHARHRFSTNTNRDTLERTGPGVWTDMVMKHAIANSPSKVPPPPPNPPSPPPKWACWVVWILGCW